MTSVEAKKVMIVEDEVILAMALEESLLRNNFQVVNISITAEEAIENFVVADPDLVIMDISLGGPMNGIAASQHMMKEKDVPFVFLTSNTNPEQIKAATEGGSYAYILKPYNEKQLIANLEIALLKFKANKALKDLLRSKDHTYSFLAHDLRAPLAAITMGTGILKNKYEMLSTDDVKDFISEIHSSANNLMTLVNNVFHWARLETGRVAIDYKRFMMDQVLQEVKESMMELADERKVSLIISNNTTYLTSDPYIVSLVLQNLVYACLNIANVNSNLIFNCTKDNTHFCCEVKIETTSSAAAFANSISDFSKSKNVSERNCSMSLSIAYQFASKLNGNIELSLIQDSPVIMKYNIKIPDVSQQHAS